MILVFFAMFLTSCNPIEKLEPTTTFMIDTPTILPPTATIQPTSQLGLEESPIIIGYIVSGSIANYLNYSQDLVNSLEASTGYQIEFSPYDNAQTAFDDLRQSNIHFMFIQPLTYLAATERDLVVPILVTNHFGLYNYGTQFFANNDSLFNTYYDEKSNKSTTTAEFALRQFEGKRPCWTEPSSLAGTIIPYGILAKNGVSFLPPAYLQNPTSVIRALYIKGICDFGATYAYTGDPRTSSQVISDLPDVLEHIEVVWQSEAFIPSLSLSASSSVPIFLQNEFKSLFLSMGSTEEGKALITEALQYDVQGFLPIEDDFYDQLREYVDAAGINPYQHLGY
ncbi:MAG TPA: PhnD/SsuA/transferrin family substrate-binding protein [Anaerolineaceae bacterium]|nr:PhnD/SsuA/transferrin family substrate-binding protein [Anaerolineaceae bacterium]